MAPNPSDDRDKTESQESDVSERQQPPEPFDPDLSLITWLEGGDGPGRVERLLLRLRGRKTSARSHP